MFTTQTNCLPMSGEPSKAAAVGELSCEMSPCLEAATRIYPNISSSRWQLYHHSSSYEKGQRSIIKVAEKKKPTPDHHK